MCKVSDKIKFCTCKAKSTEQLKNYWVFHRFIKGKFELVIGQPMLPFLIDEQTHLLNRETLLKRVNEADAFDIDLKPKQNDRLQLSFNFGDTIYDRIDYGFLYRNKKWIVTGFDSLEWMWKHEEEKFGKIENA
jgi:hypothetical protein